MMESSQGWLLLEEVEEAGDTAKHGEILGDMEMALMVGSRTLLREFTQSAVAGCGEGAAW